MTTDHRPETTDQRLKTTQDRGEAHSTPACPRTLCFAERSSGGAGRQHTAHKTLHVTDHGPHTTPLTRQRVGAGTARWLRSAVCGLQSAVGFTLVELMLVVVIITVLAATVVPRLAGRTEQAKIARAKSDIAAIGLALDLYELDVGSYPTEGNLEALVKKDPPSGIDPAQWNGPYLKKGLPKDPWGRPYAYSPQSQHNQDYDLLSFGKDGQRDTADDATNWQ